MGKGLLEGDKNDYNPSDYGNVVIDGPFYVYAVTSTVTATSTPTGENLFDALKVYKLTTWAMVNKLSLSLELLSGLCHSSCDRDISGDAQ